MPRTVLPIALLCLLPLWAGGKQRETQPMPNFSGMLKHLDEKSLVLELDDFRTLDFRRTAKTRFFDRKKQTLDPARLKPGDALSVEATQDIEGLLSAVNVYLEQAAPAAKEADAGRSVLLRRGRDYVRRATVRYHGKKCKLPLALRTGSLCAITWPAVRRS